MRTANFRQKKDRQRGIKRMKRQPSRKTAKKKADELPKSAHGRTFCISLYVKTGTKMRFLGHLVPIFPTFETFEEKNRNLTNPPFGTIYLYIWFQIGGALVCLA